MEVQLDPTLCKSQSENHYIMIYDTLRYTYVFESCLTSQYAYVFE